MSSNTSLLSQVIQGLQRSPKRIITPAVFYDAEGSKLFDDLTALPDYYPFSDESLLLSKYAADIARCLPPGTVIVELGCGSATKTIPLLDALQSLHGRCDYVGIDVSYMFLQEACKNILENVQGMIPTNLHFIQGDFLESLQEAREKFPQSPLCITWIGNTIGNYDEEDAVSFMKQVLQVVGQKCLFFLSVDQCKDTKTIYKAYQDEKGLVELFSKNALKNALAILGHVVSKEEEDSWLYELQFNRHFRRIELWITFQKTLDIKKHNVLIRENESVLVKISRKFSNPDLQGLAIKSGFIIQNSWCSTMCGCKMLYSATEALLACWKTTDNIFQEVLDWNSHPMGLSHSYLFYYGHINAFTKVNLLVCNKKEAMDDDILSNCNERLKPLQEVSSREALSAHVEETRSMVIEKIKRGIISMPSILLVLDHENFYQGVLTYVSKNSLGTFTNIQSTFKDIESGTHGRNYCCNQITQNICVSLESRT